MLKPLIIAHRGYSSRALENSLEAFRLALSLPVDMIEFDIRRSRDNLLYVMHDERTGKTCDSDIDIERSLSTDIAKIKLRNGEPVPTLNDVLSLAAGRVGLNIEVKSDGSGALTAAHVAGSGYKGEILISSFKEREVLDVKRVLPNVPVAGIFDDFSVSEVSVYKKMGYSFISLRRQAVTEDLVFALHDRSIKIYVWTVDEEEEMMKLISWGVDGIYSNKPAVLKKVVERYSRES
ncbi:MAG: glycerophosphodiester phosphodiesterase [Nitrospirota bacterium]|nr:glycerophosphodiester phosphodiesterase [Nitrospirota bacterium]